MQECIFVDKRRPLGILTGFDQKPGSPPVLYSLENSTHTRMEQRMTFLTFGVFDLENMKTWYQEKFGWIPFKDDEGICFFKLNAAGGHGIILGLFPSHELAEDIGVPPESSGFKRFTCAINFRSIAEVDLITEELRAKGVRIVREPENVFWGGYRGYIADPEDNYWELAFNPYLNE